MAGNTIRPVAAGPPRANTVRPPRVPDPINEVAEPVAAPVAVPVPVAPAPVAAPVVAPAPPAEPKKARKPAPTPAEFTAPAWDRHEGVTATGWSLFSLLDRFTGLDGLFREGLPVRYLPKLLFGMLLVLLYIGNTHYGNRMNRNIQRLKQETEDLRADYTTLKSDYMEASKQSEVARKVAAIGLVESSSPPFRIAVPAGHLDEAQLETMPVLTADTLAARAARDSVASAKADSIQGRARRQQLGLPMDDDALELGAPPPGLSPEDSAAAPANSLRANEHKQGRSTERKQNSIKKYKPAQAENSRKSKSAASKKSLSHERQR
ncbi:hypothetical protein GCM10023172_03420 [Hymenobacter ginsengisoli]|uniref:Uncharacterized protein n=1 Tax=Hymenobacter ginsengisoli TaxID=1051626 RepID=A0ABP8PWQ1_9BACT|nr:MULTISPECIES: FtsL-like putative cell division protein [unclassified Hymenobacter]MBO2030444.1 hypothetical protein [Hymenobacter sp. BT559]